MPRHQNASLEWRKFFIWDIFSAKGVQVHQEKIRAILDWRTPRNVIELRGFFRICSYYWCFVKEFSQLSAPLTNLTKKGAFKWTEELEKLFNKLKEVMSSFLVLALPNFTQPFALECDESGKGMCVILLQKGRPIAFESRKLQDAKRFYSIYDKEMLVILHALANFRQYLLGNRFIARTNHNSLHHFLVQKDLNEQRQKLVSKAQTFDFDIEYMKGRKNIVADALSRKQAACSLRELTKD